MSQLKIAKNPQIAYKESQIYSQDKVFKILTKPFVYIIVPKKEEEIFALLNLHYLILVFRFLKNIFFGSIHLHRLKCRIQTKYSGTVLHL